MPYATTEGLRAYHARRPNRVWIWQRYRAAGGCGECGLPVTRYSRCLACRLRHAAVQRRKRQRAVDSAGREA